MKLNDIYRPADHRIPEAEIYVEFYEFFQRLFAPPPVVVEARISTDERGLKYDLDEAERQFYGEEYMGLSKSSLRSSFLGSWLRGSGDS